MELKKMSVSNLNNKLDDRSIQLRHKLLRIIEHCRRGHIGSSLSLLEILRVLYDDILLYNSAQSDWPDRDRFILSKGHGCLSLYMLLAEKGFFPEEELKKVCQFKALLGGHPEYGCIPGVEASTGALGHGVSMGVGMALAAKIDNKSYKTFVLVGDGECQEGAFGKRPSAHRNITFLILQSLLIITGCKLMARLMRSRVSSPSQTSGKVSDSKCINVTGTV